MKKAMFSLFLTIVWATVTLSKTLSGTQTFSLLDTNTGCKGKPAEVYFLLDSSSSIWIVDFRKQLKFVSDLVEHFDIGPDATRVGIASFSNRFHENVRLGRYNNAADIVKAISHIRHYTGDTYTNVALDGVRSRGLREGVVRPGVQKIVIVLTDGASTNPRATIEAALKLKEEALVIAIGIGSKTNQDELRTIASEPTEKHLFEVGEYGLLDTIKSELLNSTCEAVSTSTEATTTSTARSTSTTTTPSSTSTTTEIPEEVTEDVPEEVHDQPIPEPNPMCGAHKTADVIFLLDPAETGLYQAKQIYQFIAQVTTRFNMVSGNIQVGLESDLCGGNDINMGQYKSGQAMAEALMATRYSWMTHMVKRLRTHLFQASNGARHTAKHMAVLFVDDKLNNKEELIEEARRTRCEGIELFVVTIGDAVVDSEVATLASSPVGRHIIRVKSYEHILDNIPNFLDRFCYDL